MMGQCKVSVIIPVYRVERKYLEQCLGSVMHQTLSEIEIILVDDGAPENTAKLLDCYQEKDTRIRVIHQENKGAAAARNAGLGVCNGKYVTFVDSDDYIDEKNLEIVTAKAEKERLQVLLWGTYKCYGDRKEKYMPYVEDISLFTEKQKEQLMLKTMAGSLPIYEYPCSRYGSGSACSKLYLREFLEENELSYVPDIKRAEDVNFNIRVFERANRIGYLNEYFYYYRQLGDSATYQYRENGITVFTEALMGLKSFLDEAEKSEVFYEVYRMRCMFFFLESMDMDYLNANNPKKLSERIHEMKAVAAAEPYKSAIHDMKGTYLSAAKKIPWFLIRHKMMGALMLFYWVYKKLA